MLYFNPRPNFHLLSKYILFPVSIESMEGQSQEGYAIMIDWYDTDEKVEEIDNAFKGILNRYGLNDHYDNLLFLTLGKLQEIEAIQYEINFQYNQKKRTKELAGFLLGYIEGNEDQSYTLLLKTFMGTSKVSDSNLVQWICKSIIKALIKGDMSINDYEYNIRELLFDKTDKGLILSKEKLELEAKKTIASPKRNIRALHAGFCFYIYEYLVKETNIKPDTNVMFSDAQLMFYFDLLVLFEFINRDEIDSEEKDFMRAILVNRIRTLNPHLQGNKTK